MKKADNFDAGKWLVENKITTQSNNESLNEVERERFLTDEQKADIIEFMNYGIGALQQLKQDRMYFGKKMFEKYGTDSYKSIFSSMFSGLTSMIADTKRNISGIKGGNHDYK